MWRGRGEGVKLTSQKKLPSKGPALLGLTNIYHIEIISQRIHICYWLGYKIVFCKNKQKKNSAAQRGTKHDNMTNERRRKPSTGQKKKNTLADSNYFYIEESIMCTNFRARVTSFVCAQFVKALQVEEKNY